MKPGDAELQAIFDAGSNSVQRGMEEAGNRALYLAGLKAALAAMGRDFDSDHRERDRKAIQRLIAALAAEQEGV